VGVSDSGRLDGGPLSVEVEQRHIHAKGRASFTQGEAKARGSAGHDRDGHQLSSGVTKSACSRVSFEDLIRHPSVPFS